MNKKINIQRNTRDTYPILKNHFQLSKISWDYPFKRSSLLTIQIFTMTALCGQTSEKQNIEKHNIQKLYSFQEFFNMQLELGCVKCDTGGAVFTWIKTLYDCSNHLRIIVILFYNSGLCKSFEKSIVFLLNEWRE